MIWRQAKQPHREVQHWKEQNLPGVIMTDFIQKIICQNRQQRTWVTKTVEEKNGDGTVHYVTKLADVYKVSGDAFYTQNEKNVLPLGTLTVEETKAPDGYLLDGAYMQAGDSTEQIKGMYLTQITEDGELAVSFWK